MARGHGPHYTIAFSPGLGGIGKGWKLLGRLAALLCAPLHFLWFMVPFPVVLLLFGHLVVFFSVFFCVCLIGMVEGGNYVAGWLRN